jgi:hypothetical protein
MIEPLGGSGEEKQSQLALAVNKCLETIIVRATGDEGVKDWFDIGIFGYRTDEQGEPIIESAFHGPLLETDVSAITKIADHPVEMQRRTVIVPDEETGEMLEMTVEVPVWVFPVAQGGTPMCHALLKAHEVLTEWIDEHQQSFPPIVVHITDGESGDGDPIPYAESLTSLATDDGNVLLFNCHLSATAADKFMFPASDEVLPDEYSRILFEMSSELPQSFVEIAINEGMGGEIQEGARGMAYNTDMSTLIRFLDLGTRLGLR